MTVTLVGPLALLGIGDPVVLDKNLDRRLGTQPPPESVTNPPGG
ncbi:MAG: hypothetical protein R2845_08805 [Thermomicrobiales bacterium]